MEPIIGGGGNGGAPPVVETTTATFVQDVVEASKQAPVIVDFWAPWCGPCKQITPILEKAVAAAAGQVRLVKMNIDENPEIAQQMQIQSIPAVFAFVDGRPVDGFVGVQPESKIREFIERVGKAGGQDSPVEQALEQAAAALAAEDGAAALEIYNQILQHDPASGAAAGGLVRALLATGDLAGARQALDGFGADLAGHADVQAARSALELAEAGAGAGDTDRLRAAVEADPGDHQARFDLAMALYGGGDAEGAIDALLEIFSRDRTWNDEAARTELLKIFEALGHAHPATLTGRRRLSAMLFS